MVPTLDLQIYTLIKYKAPISKLGKYFKFQNYLAKNHNLLDTLLKSAIHLRIQLLITYLLLYFTSP